MVDTVTQAGGDAVDWSKEKGSNIGNMLPDTTSIDLGSLLAQASNHVTAKTQAPKLPRVQEAEAKLQRADSVLVSNITPGSVDPDLPPPTTGADTSKCIPTGTVQSLRVALDGARTSLESALTTFKNAQQATKIASEQAIRICEVSLGAALIASAAAPGGGGAVAAFAACVACMGGAYPVQNAIRVEGETFNAMVPAMETLKKALANYQTAVLGNRKCPDFHEPIDPTKPTPIPPQKGKKKPAKKGKKKP